ncbi:MAG: Crp/Fnr family transcriptional regulator [Rhodospirillaceae bacterium]|jgi:CRP/FNR family transcriptional regulator, cyclic AMP receptor protein|nr:Crp/Fnr family transcriptional regulator [Rhodospirillaceae bacterium]MBT6117755.1 Crp/Fnr family transcriptional regulator [Rhodospirillaceae bacterium]
MSLNEEVELLRQIPLFSNVEPAKLKLLAFTSERVTFGPGQMMVQQGDIGDAAYIIIEGDADILIDTPDGPIKVATVGRNAIIGEIAILCDVPRTATVQAKTQLITLRITKDLFFRLVNEFPQMAVEIMRELARRLERTTAQLQAAMSQSGGK